MLPQRNLESVMPGRLRDLRPFAELPSDQLIVAAARTRLKRFRDGDMVIARGSTDPDDYFLLDGNVVLQDVDGNTRLLASGSEGAQDALAPLRPSVYEVRALGPVSCARMARTEVAVLREQSARVPAASATVDVARAKDTGAALFAEFKASLAANRLRLPSLPEVALRIRGAVANTRCDTRHIADLLAADPAVAAKILKLANSPLCRGTGAITSLPEAVSRIGLNTVSELVVCFSLKDLFRCEEPTLRARFAELSGAAVRTGVTAATIAARYAPRRGEQSLVAGLLGNVGALPLLERMAAMPQLVAEPQRIDALLAALAPRVGELMCRHWQLDEAVVDAVRHAGNWEHAVEGEVTLAEIVICARYHMLLGLGHGARLPRPEAVPAMRLLGAAPDPAISLEILRESKSRVDALLAALS